MAQAYAAINPGRLVFLWREPANPNPCSEQHGGNRLSFVSEKLLAVHFDFEPSASPRVYVYSPCHFTSLKSPQAKVMGVSLKTEKRSSHITVSSFRQWVRRAEGWGGTRRLKPFWQVPVKLRRPPSLPLIFMIFPDHASFSVLRETPMAFFCDYFKKLKRYFS